MTRTDIRKRDAAPHGRLLRAPVGWLTDVIGVRARRIDLEQCVESGLRNMMTKHAFRGRRPADIAHADE
jgi:hypothetical protein